EVDDSYMYMYADLISSDDYEKLLDVLDKFGEEYIEAMAKKSTKPFNSVSTEGKEHLKGHFSDYYEYTGQYDLLEVNKQSMYIDNDEDKTEVKIRTQYHVQEDFHDLAES